MRIPLCRGPLGAIPLALLTGCATVSTPQYTPVPPAPAAQPVQAVAPQGKVFKRKIAIARFSNETRYGRTLLTDGAGDPLGKQASDMFYSRLVASNQFLVFERPDLEKIRKEQKLTGQENLVGVDTLIVGAVTEFGRVNEGKVGFLSATKNQVAKAKVEIRLVDVRTGQVFFSATGSGEANTETGNIAGFGSRADYDASLNDKAIGAAVSDVMNTIVNKLQERPWRTDVLKAEGRTLYISGGARQGLQVGDRLAVMEKGEEIKSQQTGFLVTLPPKRVGTVKVSALFGDSEANEGAVCEILDGDIKDIAKLFVADAGGKP
ncbi:MAG TPA: CsgG/HfaB family protein [Holophaga sp.]|nr:CsgG/HfaB family protein [Holophaga sp.]